MQVQPYLFFNGRCEEALEFYRKALGAQVEMVMRFCESPDGSLPAPGWENKVMHASFRVGDSAICASDGHCEDQAVFAGFSLSLTVPQSSDAERIFKALSDGGQVRMPLEKTFFSPNFGMVADRFGVLWIVYVG